MRVRRWFAVGANCGIAVLMAAALAPARAGASITQLAELTEAGGAAQDSFGTSVAVDGDTVVVGAPNQNDGTGEAYVYVKPASGWSGGMVEVAKLTAGDGGPGDEFGSSVAISGNTIVVGAPDHEDFPAAGAGAAYVFVEPAGGWTGGLIQTTELTESVPMASDGFGSSVGVDGDTVAVGAPGRANGTNAGVGAAYVFVKPAAGWPLSLTQTATLGLTTPAAGDALGAAVGVSGPNVAVGAPGRNSQQGGAYVFAKPPAGWAGSLTQSEQLVATGLQNNDGLGEAVAIAGNTVAAAAPSHTVGTAVGQGAVYVFLQPANGWSGAETQAATLAPSAGVPGAGLGGALAISGDTVAAGAGTQTNGSAPDEGGAYLFTRPAAGWSGTVAPGLALTPSDGLAGDGFGTSIALSGSTVIAGAPFRQIGFNAGLGIAYVFGLATPVITVTTPADGAHYAVGAPVIAAYGCTVPGSTITVCAGSVANGAAVDTSARGAHTFSVSATSADGVSYTKTVTYSVDVPPSLRALRQSHRRWRRGRRLAKLARARQRRPPIGTAFSFKLSEAAQVQLTFTRRRRKAVASGTVTVTARKGSNTVAFAGRLDRKHTLAPGTYRVTAIANAAGVLSEPRSLTFTIVR